MNKEKLLETALREKYRFPFKGIISLEDLFSLSVENLDTVYKTLNAQFRKESEESLLDKKTNADEVLENQIEIIKYIVSIKLKEKQEKIQLKERDDKKFKIKEILASKKDAELQSKSIEELNAMLDELK